MNGDQISGIVRAILSAVGGYFVGKGVISSELMLSIVGGLATAIVGVWSVISNKTGKVIGPVGTVPVVAEATQPPQVVDPNAKK